MKRQSKAQKEAVEKAKLLQRVMDVYSGAMGGAWDTDQFATAEILSRVIPTLRELFNEQWKDLLHSPRCLRYYDTAETAAEFLYVQGVRA
jgi:hypothetical protein